MCCHAALICRDVDATGQPASHEVAHPNMQISRIGAMPAWKLQLTEYQQAPGLRRQGPIARSPSAALRLVRHGAAWYLGTSVLCMRGLPCCTLLLLAMHACRMGRWALVRMWASNEDARGQCCRCVLHRRRGSVTVFVEMVVSGFARSGGAVRERNMSRETRSHASHARSEQCQ